MRFIKDIIIRSIKAALFNYKNPRYSTFIYHLSREYVNYYRGDQSANMAINGEAKFIKQAVKDGMTVFDVGANVGDYAEKVRAIGSNVKIHCFEPDRRAFDKIENLNVIKNNMALSDVVGDMVFYRNNEHSTLNSFYDMREETSPVYNSVEPVHVKVTTLDNYCKDKLVDHIDFLKIDVEGHELGVIKGAKEMLKAGRIDMIQFEFGYAAIYSRTFLRDFFEYLMPLGYEIYKIKPLGLEKIIYSPEEERCPCANFVAVKPGTVQNFNKIVRYA